MKIRHTKKRVKIRHTKIFFSNNTLSTFKTKIQNEMQLFENEGTRGDFLIINKLPV